MLKSNLSTRPFYNDRLVSLGILLVAVITLALMAFNVTQIRALGQERAGYTTQIDRNRQEAARVQAAAVALQQTIDPSRLKLLAASTREANRLIDQRTFSWTAFFEGVEKTLPLDARLVAVAPRIERGEIQIVMIVTARALSDLEAFTVALQNSGMFYDIGPREQTMNEDGTLTARFEGGYLAPSALAAPEPDPASPPAAAQVPDTPAPRGGAPAPRDSSGRGKDRP